MKPFLSLAVLLAVVVGAYLYVTRPVPPAPTQARVLLWNVPAEELSTIAIALPRLDREEIWAVGSDGRWRFDRPDGPRVDPARWGDGIVLLLDNPPAERTIAEGPGPEDLAAFGLVTPSMTVDLTTTEGETVRAIVGDATPDGSAWYVSADNLATVHTIDATWYTVMERLVIEPPVLRQRTSAG